MQAAPMKADLIGHVLAFSALIFIASGAAYFGVASCGGYVWHKQMFCYVAPVIAISAVIVPGNRLPSFGSRVAFLLALLVGYFVIEAVGSMIYFGGENWREYGNLFIRALEYGPC
ncbi:MAG: hypothetical protein CFE43_14355 [Burkholderiales bacterium PBB3]|nr:MAG: hypothetical protein CFE43_14355 [Burkholderiales bacterium PBB3]